MKLLTAKQAKKLTKEGVILTSKRKLIEIMDAISNTANRGFSILWLNDTLSENHILELNKLGYKVLLSSDGFSTYINWE